MPDEKVIEIALEWKPDADAPTPVLLQDEHAATLLFDTSEDGHQVLVTFDGCVIAQFGYPNDEALAGHPLYAHGLGFYGMFEVLDSSWRKTLEDRNRIAFPQTLPWTTRHFVITFHDSTFECLARGFDWRLVEGSASDILGPLVASSR